MRKLGIAVILFIGFSVPNIIDAGVARRQFCEDDYQNVFLAARQAVHNVGAKIIHSDSNGGSIVGRIEADDYGHVMEISVWINRERDSRPGAAAPVWVQIQARFKKVKDPDPEQLEQLEIIEDHVFGLIRERAACGPPQ